jgi:hypothetical protein
MKDDSKNTIVFGLDNFETNKNAIMAIYDGTSCQMTISIYPLFLYTLCMTINDSTFAM